MYEERYPSGYERTRSRLRAFFRRYNRLEVSGEEHLPPPGVGALLCPNHDSYVDPLYVGAAVGTRYMRGVVEETAFNMPGAHGFLSRMGAIPIPTDAGRALDREGAMAVLDRLAGLMREQGELGVVFPEGTIKFWAERLPPRSSDWLARSWSKLRDDSLMTFRPGAVVCAARAGVPVVPCGMRGTRFALVAPTTFKGTLTESGKPRYNIPLLIPALLPVKVRVRFGAPLEIDPRAAEDMDVARAESDRLRAVVGALRDALRGSCHRAVGSRRG